MRPNFVQHFLLKKDYSETTIGAILAQVASDMDTQEHVIAYVSKFLNWGQTKLLHDIGQMFSSSMEREALQTSHACDKTLVSDISHQSKVVDELSRFRIHGRCMVRSGK